VTSRRHAPTLEVVVLGPDGEPPRWSLASPGVGWFRPAIEPGHLLVPGDELGTLDVIGRIHRLIVPRVRGLVLNPVDPAGRAGLAPRGVGYGEVLALVDPALGGAAGLADASATLAGTATGTGGVVFVAPTSGRYYGRPGPGKPAFIAVGDEVGEGATICLLEVMKTFNRVTYGGGGLPPRARVTAILVADESDVDAGAPLVQLEPLA